MPSLSLVATPLTPTGHDTDYDLFSFKSAHNYTSCRYASNDDVMRKGRVQIMMIFSPSIIWEPATLSNCLPDITLLFSVHPTVGS